MASFTSVAQEIGAFLAGKKTYVISAVTLAADAYLLYTGQVTVDQALGVAAGALGLSTVRHGVTTDVIKAGAALIATRDPAVAQRPEMAAVNGVAKAIIDTALEHAQEAAAPAAPAVQLTPAAPAVPPEPSPLPVSGPTLVAAQPQAQQGA